MTKITYTNAIDTILAYFAEKEAPTEFADALERLGELKEQIAKRNSKVAGKPTKTQRENADIKQKILDTLLVSEGKRCGDIANEVGISPQKCSALLSQMVTSGDVERIEGKKKVTLFQRAGE